MLGGASEAETEALVRGWNSRGFLALDAGYFLVLGPLPSHTVPSPTAPIYFGNRVQRMSGMKMYLSYGPPVGLQVQACKRGINIYRSSVLSNMCICSLVVLNTHCECAS